MDEDQVMEWEDAIPSQPEDKYDLLDKLVNPDFEYYDDKAKLLANSLTGGIYDLGQLFWEGNPLSYMTGEDFQGLPEWATGMTPIEDGGGTFFDYDEDFKPWGFDPESVENVGRAVSSLAVPFAGWATAPVKGKKIYDAMSKVFPSLKHWDDVGIMNQKIRAAINAEKGVKSNWPKITALWDRIRPLYQAPYRAARHIINPLRWRKNYDAKLGEKILSYPNKIKAIKHMSKISKPERNYAATAARNWALATGARAGVEGIKSLVDRHPKKFDRYSYEGEFDMGSAAPYEDKIMKMAKSNKPKIGIQFSDGPMYWG